MTDSSSHQEATLLFRVENVFQIEGRGCILLPGIPRSFHPPIRCGAALQLRRPDGTSISTSLGAFELINTPKRNTAVLVADIDKTEVPIGTDVLWVFPGSV